MSGKTVYCCHDLTMKINLRYLFNKASLEIAIKFFLYNRAFKWLLDTNNTFAIVRMSHLDSHIPSNIYYGSIDSEILTLARTNSDTNTFATLSIRLLKRMQKQGSKHTSIISMRTKSLVNISLFSKFLQTQQQISSNFFIALSLFLVCWLLSFLCHLSLFLCI